MAALEPHERSLRSTASVIIPAYDVADILPRAIRSALDQSAGLDDLEVIVVDDASRDETNAVAQALASQNGRIRVLRMGENGGPGAARAKGLAAARGNWIAILDADDAMEHGRLGRLIGAAEHRNLDLIADNLILCDPQAGPFRLAFPLQPAQIIALSPQRVLANTIPGGRVNLGWMKPVIRREFLQRHAITWQPVRHAEDTLFLMQVLLAGARAELLGEPGYFYTQRRGSISGSKSPHSRTRPDADEQIRALDMLEQLSGPSMSADLQRRLARLRPEIHVATNVIFAQEHLRQGRYAAAARNIAKAAASPLALARCIAARFGPGSRRVL